MSRSAEGTAAPRGEVGAQAARAEARPESALELAYRALTSERTTSILVILFAALVALTAFIPQGREALELARDAGATTIHQLARFGLTDVFGSAWLKALSALLGANLVGLAVSSVLGEKAAALVKTPSRAPHSAELVAALPEQAVERLRERFRVELGVPIHEEADGSRASLVFDTAPGGRAASILTHLGLIVLVLGAGLAARPADVEHGMAHAKLEVKDMSTGKVGNFDIVQGETFTFFRWPARYVIRGYVPHLEGFGPAIRVEREDERGQREDFWVFQNAPAGFDERHRRGEVGIVAKSMGYVAPPGQGMGSSEGAILLLVGLGLLAFGALEGRRVAGRLWITADGERVSLLGVPRSREDRRFARQFNRWSALATAVLADD